MHTLTHEQIFAAAKTFLRDLNAAWDARPEEDEDGPVRESAEPEADPGRALADWYAELFSSFAGDAIPAKLRAAAAEDLAHGEWGIAQDEAGHWTVHHNAEVDAGPVRESEHTPFTGIDAHGHKWVQGKQVAIGDHQGAALAHTAQAQSHAAQAQGQPAAPPDHRAAAADYAQNGTRAKAFKNWFGDWEGDPEKASKVVNEQGEPQETHNIPGTGSKVKDKGGKPVTVYHGTASGGFTAFDASKVARDSLYGPGFYFTEDQEVGQSYLAKDAQKSTGTAELKSAYLNIRKPFDLDRQKVSAAQLELPESYIGKTLGGDAQTAKTVDEWKEHFKEEWFPKELIGEKEGDLFGHYTRDTKPDGSFDRFGMQRLRTFPSHYMRTRIQKLGYDGFTHIGGDRLGGGHHHRVWIAFEPAQIKAVANRGTFDSASANINESLDLLEAQARAPVGGITIAGTHFPGGRWIPGNVLAQATPEEKEKLNAADDDKAAARKARGPVDQDALKANLAQHSNANVTGGHAGVRRSYHALRRHHGELVLHRVEELHDLLAATLADLPAGNSLKKAGVQRALAKLHAMMSVHDEPPKVKKHGKLDAKVGGGAGGGLPAGQPLGGHAGEQPAAGEAGTGGGTGQGLAGLPAHDDVGGAGTGAHPAGAGHAPGGGPGTGAGPTIPDGPVEESLFARPTPDNPTDTRGPNWRYPDKDFVKGGLKAKYNDNLAALKTLRAIRDEGRATATPAEQAVLSKFVGWGQFPALFNDYHDYEARREREAADLKEIPHEETQKWAKERQELKNLLSDEEYASARRSTLNAHYTHPDVVEAHWKMAQKLGFKGGRFLETSAGIGYYMGLMPDELSAKTKTSAVELDDTTAAMLQMLYPRNNVQHQGFQEHQAPEGFYDLVASNVPFGDYGVHDATKQGAKYNRLDANIHDYFFLKSADLTRPGGLVMHITSTGTLDKPNSKIRDELAKTCDFVGAVRFPGGAHKENAGTEVVTDMIILRKRHPGEAPVTLDHTPPEAEADEPGFTGTTVDSLGRLYHWVDGKRVPGPDWTQTTAVADPAGGEAIPVNKYFAEHPDQILGTLDRTGTMYRKNNVNVSKTDDYDEKLQGVIDRLPAGVLKPQKVSKAAFQPDVQPAPGDVKEGGFQVKGGKLYVRQGGGMVEQKPPSAAVLARIQGHLDVRDAVRATLNDQLEGRDASASRQKLNEVYDAFVAEHGLLNSRQNTSCFDTDPDAPVLLSLEKYDPKAKTAEKADIFSKDTVRHVPRAESAADVESALGISLHETGGVHLERMGELLGRTPEEVGWALTKKGIAYNDPGEGWQPADQYLSGNVRKKLTLAQAAAAADPKYQANVEALLKAQPEDVDHADIEVRLGACWVPPSDIKAFAAEMLRMRPEHFEINHIPATGEWLVGVPKKYQDYLGRTAGQEWQVSDEQGRVKADFQDILTSALNNKSIKIYYPAEDDEKAQLNTQATQDAAAKVQQLKEAFSAGGGAGWIWEDDARRDRLHRFYNDNFNNIVPMQYNGQHQSFPGMNPGFNPHPHIKDFVWQVVTTGSALAAHEVGMGKTAAMIMSAMELRRLGSAKKPAIACLKANIEAIVNEAIRVYPGIKILSTADMFDAKSRKATLAKIATGDYDLVVMTHEHLNSMQMRPEAVRDYIGREMGELTAAIIASKKEDDTKGNKVVKQLEKAKQRLQKQLDEALDASKKDNAVFFEETGIDQLFVDEAHNFKTLPVYTKQDRVKGIPSGRSQRATNMKMRTDWLQKNNKGRGVVFATGTPVTNTMAELYTMQRYLQPEVLKERGIDSFDAWASAFGDKETKMELSATGEYKAVSRFSKFVNIPELMQMARQFTDVQRVDSGKVNIVRPTRKDSVTAAPQSDAQAKLMTDLQARAQELKGKPPGEKGGDNMLVICMDGRKGATDMRLLDATLPDHPDSKVNKMVANVLAFSKDNPGKTQTIFSDLGVHPMKKKAGQAAPAEDEGGGDEENANAQLAAGDTRFHLYGDVIAKLVKGGIPREKIADFSQLAGAKKEAAMEAMRQGDILVGIGSTKKLGTGVNVQNKLGAMHHLDTPGDYTPAGVEQRNGRGWRQGNENKDVQVHTYVTEGSLDQFTWQLISNKDKFIKQVMTTTGGAKERTARDDDAEELSPEQFMAAASGDPRILEKVNLDEDVRKLRAGQNRHEREQRKLAQLVKDTGRNLPVLQKEAEGYQAAIDHLAAHPDFALTVGGQTHTERPAATDAFALAVAAADEKAKVAAGNIPDWKSQERQAWETPVATYRGLDVVRKGLGANKWNEQPRLFLRTPEGEYFATGETQSLGAVEHAARGLHKKKEQTEAFIKKDREDTEKIKAKIGAAFPKAEELKGKHERLKQLEQDLRGKGGQEEKLATSAAADAAAVAAARADRGPTRGDMVPRRQQLEDTILAAAANGADSDGIHTALNRTGIPYEADEAREAIKGLKDSGRVYIAGGKLHARKKEQVVSDPDNDLLGTAPARESLRESADAAGHEHRGKGDGGGQFTAAIARHVAAAHAADKHLPIDLKTLYHRARADHPGLTVPQFHDHLHQMQKAGTLTLHPVTRDDGTHAGLRSSEYAMPLRDADGTVPKNRHGEPWEVYGYAAPGKTVHESLRESAAAPAAQHTPFTGIDGHGHKWVQGKQVAIGDHAGAAQAHTAAAQSHQAAHERSQAAPQPAPAGQPAAAPAQAAPAVAAQKPAAASAKPGSGAPAGGKPAPKFEVSPWLSDGEKEIEQQTQERAHAEYPALRDKYLKAGNGTFDAQGNLKSVVLNTDEWRPLFHEYNGVNAGAVHNASSHLNKQLYNEALQEQKGKGNGRLLILAGGGGSGKGTATGQFFKQSDYPLVLDQASDNYPKLEQKLDEAVKNGYKPLHVFIDRPPEAAWGGVVGRAVNLHKKGQVPRTVPLDIALKANVEARKATLDLLKRRPDIEVAVVDNVGGDPGSRRLLTDRAEAITHLEKQIKGDEELLASGGRDRLRDDVVRRVKSGEIPRHVGAGLIGEKELVNGLRAEVSPDHAGGAAAGPAAVAGRPEPGRTAGTGGAGQAPHGAPAEGQGRTGGEAEGGRLSAQKPPAPTGGQGGGARG